MKRSVCVSGAEGFVGKHLCAELERRGYLVFPFDIKSGVDARDFFRQSDLHFDAVYHLAAVVGGRMTIDNAPLDVAVDLSIDAEAIQFALRTKPGRFVYFSSSAAYPVSLQTRDVSQRLHESDIDLQRVRQPDSSYGWVKLSGEMQCAYLEAAGVKTTVIRPFSGFGADQALAYPWPSFIDRARRRVSKFDIWGDGSQRRDWIHIDDVVSATIDAVEQEVPGPINLGCGSGTSFKELAELVTDMAGYSPDFNYIPSNPTGVHTRVSNNSKMLSFYEPKVSLEQAIEGALHG